MEHDSSRRTAPDDTEAPPADPPQAATKKPYKTPVISRHGNLRLMTQLE